MRVMTVSLGKNGFLRPGVQWTRMDKGNPIETEGAAIKICAFAKRGEMEAFAAMLTRRRSGRLRALTVADADVAKQDWQNACNRLAWTVCAG